MTVVLFLVGAGVLASVVAFSFYSIKTIVRSLDSASKYAVALAYKQADVDRLSGDILLWADENKRLKSAVKALESSNAELLKNSKLTPSAVIDTADDRLRRLLPTP